MKAVKVIPSSEATATNGMTTGASSRNAGPVPIARPRPFLPMHLGRLSMKALPLITLARVGGPASDLSEPIPSSLFVIVFYTLLDV